MITVKYKGFVIQYEEEAFEPRWKSTVKLKGTSGFFLEGKQLKEVKRLIDEALSIVNYEPVVGYRFSFDDFNEKDSFGRSIQERITPIKAKIEKDIHNGGEIIFHYGGYEIKDRNFYPANEKNKRIIEELIKIRQEKAALTEKLLRKFKELENFDHSTFIEIKNDVNANIKKKIPTLNEKEKADLTDRLHKESKMERIYCTSALKDAKWNYKLAVEKLVLLKKEKKNEII